MNAARRCCANALRALVLLVMTAFATAAFAHKPSDSYLRLRATGTQLDGQWDIALRDLDVALALDRNDDGAIDWGEVRTRLDDVNAYALSRLSIASAGETCDLKSKDLLIDHHTDGAYAVLMLQGSCAAPIDQLSVDYRLLFELDAQHRGLLNLQRGAAASAVTTAVFASDSRMQHFSLQGGSAWRDLAGFVRDGVRHIAIGYDHVLFLVALLLPAVLCRERRVWIPVGSLSIALWNVAKTVTAFTVAHSITLSLATLGWIELPSRLVESAIALSVLVTAIDNIVPILPRQRWLVAFVFGLLHGFGFASVLQDLDLPRASLALSLFGFNLGVEIGQLVLVAALIPLAHVLREKRLYTKFILRIGSLLIAVLALGWLVERSFGLRLMPF